MLYREPRVLSEEQLEAAFSSGTPAEIAEGLVGFVLAGLDANLAHQFCLRLSAHPSLDVRGAVVTCWGHLARIHGSVRLNEIEPILRNLAQDPELRGQVEDTWDDFETYLGIKRPSCP
jgi:hypothetical protein